MSWHRGPIPYGLGYVTSACHAPTLGQDIPLGSLRDGRARTGAVLRAVCQLRDRDTACRMVPLLARTHRNIVIVALANNRGGRG